MDDPVSLRLGFFFLVAVRYICFPPVRMRFAHDLIPFQTFVIISIIVILLECGLVSPVTTFVQGKHEGGERVL